MANEINVQLGEPHTPRIGLERIMYSPTTIIYDPNPATTEEAGIVELATNAETLAGTDNERAVTPAGLHSTIGEANGIAQLDNNGKVPSSQLPSYVDDVIEGYLYNNHFYKDSAHTELVDNDQEGGLIYIDLSTNLTYRWGGSTYVEISPSLALGETSTTAYRGDRGKAAYDHATDANRNTTAQTKKLYKMSVTSEGHVGQVEESTAETDIANLQENVEDLDNGLFKGGWRTPISNEWDYVLNTRSASTVSGTANARFAKAQINSVNGLILLPDVFELPSGITLLNINATNATAADNTYTTSQWETLENAGCVFLPCSGYRDGTSMSNINSYGFYSTSQQAYTATLTVYLFLHSGSSGISITYTAKRMGKSVRLIKENTEGAFSISSTLKANMAKSNLQFHCLNKEWRFAPNAYDVIGNDNSNIAENYNGYIDLFGFGTSGWNSGAVCYQPWNNSTNNADYINHDLTGDYKNADWGVYNIKKQLHNIAFTGDYNDLENVPLGDANGIAQLDNNGKVPSSQLPSYVDDVIEGYLYNNHFYEDSAHTILSPSDQESGKIFVDLQDNLSYRWSGSTYVEISQSLALGETSSTAYRGDRGKVAYDHATDANRVTTAQSSGLYKIAVTSEGHIASVTAVTASDIPTQDATETQKGVVELATDAETKAGTDTGRVITPHGLASVLPIPTAADEDKLLSVNSSGEYELITIINSELIPY